MEDELFDVFDEKTSQPNTSLSKKEKKNRKRSANGDIKNETVQPNGDAQMEGIGDGDEKAHDDDVEANGATERDVKRHKRDDEPEPVVTDTFETEQSREVAASAGLQAAKDDKAVGAVTSSSTSGLVATRLRLRAHRTAQATLKRRREHGLSPLIPSRRSPSSQSNGTNQCSSRHIHPRARR